MKRLLKALIDAVIHRNRYTIPVHHDPPVRIPLRVQGLDHFLTGPQCDENVPEYIENGERSIF